VLMNNVRWQFIPSEIYIAPLQGNYLEALPTPVRTTGFNLSI